MNENATSGPVELGNGAQSPPVPTEEEILAETQPHTVFELIKEYIAKLERLAEQARAVRAGLEKSTDERPGKPKSPERAINEMERWALHSRIEKLRPAIRQLLRYTSGLIENTRLKPVLKLELRLRSAELEGTLDVTESVIQSLPL